jgi:hypothetical protein
MQPEEKITWELQQHPDMLVVESIITNELKQQAVHLMLSNTYFDGSAPKNVSGATIVVTDGVHPFRFLESNETPGWYFSEQSYAAESLKTYSLSIQLQHSINGLMEYTAQSQLPQGLEMDSMICEIYKTPKIIADEADDNKEKDTTILGIYYFGKEPQTAENFYFAKVFRNKKLLYTNPKEYTYFNTASQNASYTHLMGFQKNVAGNDTIRCRLFTIGKDYYHYLEAIQNSDFSGNAYSMSGPPANAVGNISDGKALGYFLAAYVSDKETKAVDKR